MGAQEAIYVITGFLGLLVGVISFFLKQLLIKFDRVETSLTKLSEKIAVIMAHQDHYQADMESRVLFESRIDKEIKDIRLSHHNIMDLLHSTRGKLDIFQEICPKLNRNRDD